MPKVSIIVPCYNEQPTIRLLLNAISQQRFALDEMEVIIADGMSTDDTRQEIIAFQNEHPDLMIRIVDNPQRNIPAALNRALEAATGEFIVRLDAHSMPDEMYVTHSVAGLEAGLGDNVGGVWNIQPGSEGWAAGLIAVAAAHPLGVGGALYRYATTAAEVDTVPFGAFRRSLLDTVGMFDETLLTNEDYEFNTRIRLNGGKIWLNHRLLGVFCKRNVWEAGAAIFPLRFLEMAYVEALSGHPALAAGFASGVCVEPDRAGDRGDFLAVGGHPAWP